MLVIGGGLAGAAIAYYLAGEGVEVVLVDRGELNREASGTNAGSFHFQIALHQLTAFETENVRGRLETEVRLHAEAAAVWATLEQELGASMDVHVTGGLMVAETPSSFSSCGTSRRSSAARASRPTCSGPPSCASSRRTSPT